jgi:hypothetical protein
MQWAISIGRWDIQTAVMTLSSFRAQPRIGHLLRVKRMYAYLIKFRYFKIRFDTREPDYEAAEIQKYDWDNTAYGNGEEDLPLNAPKPKGKRVVLTHYFDANLMHDILSGKSVTGVFHMANMTPIMWYLKKAATTETATYGAEFLAARTCMEHIVDLRNSFRYLGVPVFETSYVWGDNESQVKSSTIPYAKLNKRHNILSYHYVRQMVAKGFINMQHIRSEWNLADTLSKHWSHQSNYKKLIKPLLNYHDYENMIDQEELPESMEWIGSSNQTYRKDSFIDICTE